MPKDDLEHLLHALFSDALQVRLRKTFRGSNPMIWKLNYMCQDYATSILCLQVSSPISTSADFFSMGGASLKASILVARLRKHLDLPQLPGSALYQNSTIAALASVLENDYGINRGLNPGQSSNSRQAIVTLPDLAFSSDLHGSALALSWAPSNELLRLLIAVPVFMLASEMPSACFAGEST
jgi:hypothetical protein